MLPESTAADNPPRILSDDEFRRWKSGRASADGFSFEKDFDPEPPEYCPDPLDDAERLGFELAMSGEFANPPAGMGLEFVKRFFDGVVRAWDDQAREAFDSLDDVNDFLDEVEARWSHAEATEANGVFSARKDGGH